MKVESKVKSKIAQTSKLSDSNSKAQPRVAKHRFETKTSSNQFAKSSKAGKENQTKVVKGKLIDACLINSNIGIKAATSKLTESKLLQSSYN